MKHAIFFICILFQIKCYAQQPNISLLSTTQNPSKYSILYNDTVGWTCTIIDENAVYYTEQNKVIEIVGDTIKAIEVLLERMDVMQRNLDSIVKEHKYFIQTTAEMYSNIYLDSNDWDALRKCSSHKEFIRLIKREGYKISKGKTKSKVIY